MTEQHVTAKVPGKIMLSGEYAVLFGGRALAGSIDRFLTVELTGSDQPLQEDATPVNVTIASDLWEKPVALTSVLPPEDLASDPLVDAVAASVQRFAVNQHPVQVRVTSELDTTHGVGSSSALRLGVAAATWFYANSAANAQSTMGNAMSQPRALTPSSQEWDVVRFAYRLQKRSQKRASGYDFATQFLGGLVEMNPPLPQADEESVIRAWPGSLSLLDDGLPGIYEKLATNMLILVGGEGAPTALQMKDVLSTLDTDERVQALMRVSETLHEAWLAWFRGDTGAWPRLLAAVGDQRRFFEGTRNFPSRFAEAIGILSGLDEVWSYKTTGAGGEDAILVLAPETMHGDILAAVADAGWTKAPFHLAAASTSVTLH